MKKITLFLMLILGVLTINAQNLVISNGEEDTGLGWWQAGSTNVEIVDWHPKDGNPSEKSMTIWISPDSDVWSGGGLGGLNINVNTYNAISVLVYKNVAGTVRLELQDGVNNYFVSANYNTPSTWQKLEFDIPSEMGNIQTLLIAPFIDYDLSTITNDGDVHQSRCFWDEVEAFYKIPTPVSEIKNENRIISTQIYSITGSLLQTLDTNATIYKTSLPKGIYIIKSIDELNNEVTSKVVKTY